MKIALCFSGQIRDIERTKEFWVSLIKQYDMDVYASFWDTENEANGDTLDNFVRIYNAKKLEVESYHAFNKTTLSLLQPLINPPKVLNMHFRNSIKMFGVYSQKYKIWKANMLTKTTKIDYDIVIRARTDSYLKGDIQLVKNDMLNIPTGIMFSQAIPYSTGLNDIFAFGKPRMMDYYSTMYLHMISYLNEGNHIFPAEHLLYVHMSKVNTNIRFMPNHLVITRQSKGMEDEIYNRFVENPIEDILPTNLMEVHPTPEDKNIYQAKEVIRL